MTQTERELLEALKAVLQWIDDNCETTGFETVEAQADAAIVKAEAHRREDMTNDIEQLKREICAARPVPQQLERLLALHRDAAIEDLCDGAAMPEQCNVALISNYQGAGEYRNLSREYCDTTAKYSEKQMREAIAAAVLRERERILNCYSPDDTKVSDFNGYPDLAVCCGS